MCPKDSFQSGGPKTRLPLLCMSRIQKGTGPVQSSLLRSTPTVGFARKTAKRRGQHTGVVWVRRKVSEAENELLCFIGHDAQVKTLWSARLSPLSQIGEGVGKQGKKPLFMSLMLEKLAGVSKTMLYFWGRI